MLGAISLINIEKLHQAELGYWIGKPYWSQGPRLSDRMQSLAGEIDGQFAAPTQAQMNYLAELESEFAEKVARVNTLFTETLPALNARMQEQGIPGALLPAALEMPAP